MKMKKLLFAIFSFILIYFGFMPLNKYVNDNYLIWLLGLLLGWSLALGYIFIYK